MQSSKEMHKIFKQILHKKYVNGHYAHEKVLNFPKSDFRKIQIKTIMR